MHFYFIASIFINLSASLVYLQANVFRCNLAFDLQGLEKMKHAFHVQHCFPYIVRDK
jgi:hypothetical protein